MAVADLKPRGVKAPLQLVPAVLLELYASTASAGQAAGQMPWSAVPARLLECCAAAFADGAAKYAPWNWLHQGDMHDMRETYTGAMLRHIHALSSGEDVAPDSGVSHIGHAAACAAILAHHMGVQADPARVAMLPMASDERLANTLAEAAHTFADPTRPNTSPARLHYLAVVVRCLGDLADRWEHGYTPSTAVLAAQAGSP